MRPLTPLITRRARSFYRPKRPLIERFLLRVRHSSRELSQRQCPVHVPARCVCGSATIEIGNVRSVVVDVLGVSVVVSTCGECGRKLNS